MKYGNLQDISFLIHGFYLLRRTLEKKEGLSWDISTSSQVSNCDGVLLENYFDHKFQWPQEGLNCESLAYELVT